MTLNGSGGLELPLTGLVTRQEFNDLQSLVMMEHFIIFAILLEIEPARAQGIAMSLRERAKTIIELMKDGQEIGLDVEQMRADWNSDVEDLA